MVNRFCTWMACPWLLFFVHCAFSVQVTVKQVEMDSPRYVRMAGVRRGYTVLVDTLRSYVYHVNRSNKSSLM